MKALDFLKRYQRRQRSRESSEVDKNTGSGEDHSLEAQARERARHPDQLNVGTPFDWEDLEAYQKELERLEREGPGLAGFSNKPPGSGKAGKPTKD